MDTTRQHLLRVSDIIGEIETRLRSLRLQAQKAERYKRYKAELKDIELWSASQRYLGDLAEEKSLREEQTVITGQHEVAAGTLGAEEVSVEAERLSVTEELAELNAAKYARFALSNKAQLGRQRADHYDDEAAALTARAEAARDEIADLRARSAQRADSIAGLEGELALLDQEAEASRQSYEVKAADHDQARAALTTARRELEACTSDVASGRARIARNESEKAAAAARRDDLTARLEG